MSAPTKSRSEGINKRLSRTGWLHGVIQQLIAQPRVAVGEGTSRGRAIADSGRLIWNPGGCVCLGIGDKKIIEGTPGGVPGKAQAGSAVCLRIAVHEQDAESGSSQ